MKKECNIVKDLLPLYIDKVSSKESNEYIKKHLEECEECKSELEYLKNVVLKTNEKEVVNIKKFKILLQKKVIIRVISWVIILYILFFAILYLVNGMPIKQKFNNYMKIEYLDNELKFKNNKCIGDIDKKIISTDNIDYIFINYNCTLLDLLKNEDQVNNVSVQLDYDKLKDNFKVYYVDNLKDIDVNSKNINSMTKKSYLMYESNE